MKEKRIKYIMTELTHHLPFSIFGVTMALILMGILSFLAHIGHAEAELPHASEELFHIFHPAHVLFSAVATTAMFWKHDNGSVIKAALVGFIGSVAVCGISDIFFPFVGGLILGNEMHFHVCLFDDPGLILPFAVVGVISGLMVTETFEKSTEYSHGVHVFLSAVASLLYLISFGMTDWTHAVGGVFIVTVLAVILPCCGSDIIFPLACTHKYCKHTEEEGLHHH